MNDISGGYFDENLLPTVAETKLPYILMHSNTCMLPCTKKIRYEDINECELLFLEKVNQLQKLGIHDIILDPGFGFGKRGGRSV